MIQLFPYQEEGVKAYSDRTLNCDEVGLGKTIQTLQYILQNPQLRPCVICCPSSLKLNWQKEARDKFFLDSIVLSGETPYYIKNKDRLIIINYDMLQYWLKSLRFIEPKLIVGDECHLLSNIRAMRTRAFRLLCKKVDNVIVLGATPFTNDIFELYPMLNLLWPEEFDSPWAFGMMYCSDADKSRGKWTFKGSKNLLSLNKKLKELGMIRRTKEEVLTELPPVITSVIPIELDPDQYKEYQFAEKDLRAWLIQKYNIEKADKAIRAERFTRFTYLKHLAAQLKLKKCMELIDNLLITDKGKMLVCVIHKDITKTLSEKYNDLSLIINGDVSPPDRQIAEERFQTDPSIRMLLNQIRAGGIGLNFTAGSIALFCELGWNPALHHQFVGRCHRIGQTRKVRAIFLVAANTIEEKLCKIIQVKEKYSNFVLDGVEDRTTSLNVFDLLQEELMKDENQGTV